MRLLSRSPVSHEEYQIQPKQNIYNKKRKSFIFNKKSPNLILQSPKLKTGYGYENQF